MLAVPGSLKTLKMASLILGCQGLLPSCTSHCAGLGKQPRSRFFVVYASPAPVRSAKQWNAPHCNAKWQVAFIECAPKANNETHWSFLCGYQSEVQLYVDIFDLVPAVTLPTCLRYTLRHIRCCCKPCLRPEPEGLTAKMTSSRPETDSLMSNSAPQVCTRQS